MAKAVRDLRRSGAGDKQLVSEIGSETAKLERYLDNLTKLGRKAIKRRFKRST